MWGCKTCVNRKVVQVGQKRWESMMSNDRELKDQRIPIMMTESEVTAIDDWAFKNRIRSRGEAIRRLCQIALMFDEKRMDLVRNFADAYSTTAKIVDTSEEVFKQGKATDFELQLITEGLDTLRSVSAMSPLIKVISGITNNYKSDREINDLIKESEEILERINNRTENSMDK
jgi:hypothetical protein